MAIFEQSIRIKAATDVVDRCITEQSLMAQWLNPFLSCESIGPWSVGVGSRFCFRLNVPILSPVLDCLVKERGPGLVEWEFSGFFVGTDRWECFAQEDGTLLVNRFCFEIPNPLVQVGFNLFAANLTRRDMLAQLQRLKTVAEKFSNSELP
jgi:Polyketide cyclase / dehydrase and lipid transport